MENFVFNFIFYVNVDPRCLNLAILLSTFVWSLTPVTLSAQNLYTLSFFLLNFSSISFKTFLRVFNFTVHLHIVVYVVRQCSQQIALGHLIPRVKTPIMRSCLLLYSFLISCFSILRSDFLNQINECLERSLLLALRSLY